MKQLYIVTKRGTQANWSAKIATEKDWESAWDNADYRDSHPWGQIQAIARWFKDFYFFLVEAMSEEQAIRHAKDWMEEYYDK